MDRESGLDRCLARWRRRDGFASVSLIMILMPVLVTWALQYIALQGMLLAAQRESYSAVYDAERVAVLDMDPIAYLAGSPSLDKVKAAADLASALPVNLANVDALVSTSFSSGEFNPGEADSLADSPAPVVNPTIHVKGVVNVKLYGGVRQIKVDAVHVIRLS